MAQTVPEFSKLNDWDEIAKKLVDKYPERYGHIDVSKIVAYVITNKEKTDITRPYEMQTDKLPMRLSNQYDYFVWFKHPEEWHDKPKNLQAALVLSALERIDIDNPFNVLPLDYKDQAVMVNTFGIAWTTNEAIPDVLKNNVNFRD